MTLTTVGPPDTAGLTTAVNETVERSAHPGSTLEEWLARQIRPQLGVGSDARSPRRHGNRE
jgi:hypothetical protein